MKPKKSLRNIVLIGFMGTGKTSVGRILSRKLKRAFVDIDHEIELSEKRSIREIFEKDGEGRFREIENKMVSKFAARKNLIITTGGGAVMDPENVRALRAGGWLVALLAKPETIYERVRASRHRPLLAVENPADEIKRLLEIRRPFYEQADYFFHTDGKNSREVAKEIVEIFDPKQPKLKGSED